MARHVLLIGFFIMMAVFWVVLDRMGTGEYNPKNIPSEFIGKSAPDINVPDLLDASVVVKTADMKDQIWLFNVWGTWCPECWREHEFLVQLKNAGVTIVGLNWRDEKSEAISMLDRLGNPFAKIGYDPDSSVAMDWGVYGAPETFLIDAEGTIVVKHTGGLTPKVWQQKFLPHFKQPAEAQL